MVMPARRALVNCPVTCGYQGEQRFKIRRTAILIKMGAPINRLASISITREFLASLLSVSYKTFVTSSQFLVTAMSESWLS